MRIVVMVVGMIVPGDHMFTLLSNRHINNLITVMIITLPYPYPFHICLLHNRISFIPFFFSFTFHS